LVDGAPDLTVRGVVGRKVSKDTTVTATDRGVGARFCNAVTPVIGRCRSTEEFRTTRRTNLMINTTKPNRVRPVWGASLAVIALTTSIQAQQPPLRPVLRYAEVNANDVYVRSGDSTNHYTVCKLHAGDRVAVVSVRGEWVEILPPKQAFSLISGDYVDTTDGKTGVVNGNNVRVRAGSVLNDSKYTVQTMLSRGAKVTILGRNPDGFLRIKPPANATLWIHADYLSDSPEKTTPSSSSTTSTPVVGDPAKIDRATAPLASPEGAVSDAKVVVPGEANAAWRKQLDELDAAAKLEMEKEPGEREFDSLLSGYKVIMNQNDDEYARRYAEIRYGQIENIRSLADAVARVRALGAQADAQRQKFMDKRASLPPGFARVPTGLSAQGELRVSALYPPGSTVRRFRLIDPNASFERTLGYVEIPPDRSINVKEYIGRYVGVRASQTRLQKGGVDPIPIYIAEELVLLKAPPKAPATNHKD